MRLTDLFAVALWGLAVASVAQSRAEGIISASTQPRGGLSGKIVFTHAGHGYTADNKRTGRWSFQRGEGFELIEDLGNYDQMSLLVEYLFRAGATIVPLRPVGHQTREVVIDNGDSGVEFVGAWEDGNSPIYFGGAGSVPFRTARTSRNETARARYRPEIPESGFYPVYAWMPSGADRATDQRYRVHHAGGDTEVTVNHRRVGNGLVYLGTYYFEAGTSGYVDISNRSSNAGDTVAADMIRFGNGRGDINRGGGVSGLAREDEAGLYWVKWHADRAQGIVESDYRATDDDRQAAISFSPRYAAFMNREADGRLKDRVFVSFHSNAGGRGKARGVLGLLNGNNDPSTATPNQSLLAKSLAKQVNDSLVAHGASFEHKWHDRGGNVTLDRDDIEFGEINNHYVRDEFDATIVEVGFHDNHQDAELMRDPRARDAIARATYHGLLAYFRAIDNNETSPVRLPGPPTSLRVESNEARSVTIHWAPPQASPHVGDAPTSYCVYASKNGYGFDGGTEVPGGASSSVTLRDVDPNTVYFFRVAAVNEGGESPPSEVVAALPAGGTKKILVVNGFDRLERVQNPKQPFGRAGNTVDRVRPRQSNSRDYVIQVAAALQSASPGGHFESASNESVASGDVQLQQYHSVFWILGEESTRDSTLDAGEQAKLEAFIASGGNLFVSGSEIAWDLDQQKHGRSFFRDTLQARFVADDANTYEVAGAPDGIFSDLAAIHFDDGKQFYEVDFPDVIAAQPGAQVALNYASGAGAAAVQVAGADHRGRVVLLAFPFETITTPRDRAEVIDRVLRFFDSK